MLAPGTLAPDFDKATATGERIRLADLRGKKRVVLFFYPGDFTPVCTAEACLFRDASADLADQGTVVIGVSKDGSDSHARFASEHRLGYPLLSDEDHAMARAYGVKDGLSGLVGWRKRATFVIDERGVVRHVVHAELSADQHLAEVKRALATLGAPAGQSAP